MIMTRASSHTCHAIRCKRHVPPRLHMCAYHWGMVPRPQQRTLWAHYVRGQENRMDPTAEYLTAAAACVRAVAEQEDIPEAEIAFEVSMYEAWAEMVSP